MDLSTPFSIKDWSIHGFGYGRVGPRTNSPWILSNDYNFFFILLFKYSPSTLPFVFIEFELVPLNVSISRTVNAESRDVSNPENGGVEALTRRHSCGKVQN